MKARLVDINNSYYLLHQDGFIQKIDKMVLSDLLRNFSLYDGLTNSIKEDNLPVWSNDYETMKDYPGETVTYIDDDFQLVIRDFNVFMPLFTEKSKYIDDFISTDEYAKAVGKSVEQVKVHLRNDRIPSSRKIGRDWVIAKESIYKYPEDRRVTSGRYIK